MLPESSPPPPKKNLLWGFESRVRGDARVLRLMFPPLVRRSAKNKNTKLAETTSRPRREVLPLFRGLIDLASGSRFVYAARINSYFGICQIGTFVVVVAVRRRNLSLVA